MRVSGGNCGGDSEGGKIAAGKRGMNEQKSRAGRGAVFCLRDKFSDSAVNSSPNADPAEGKGPEEEGVGLRFGDDLNLERLESDSGIVRIKAQNNQSIVRRTTNLELIVEGGGASLQVSEVIRLTTSACSILQSKILITLQTIDHALCEGETYYFDRAVIKGDIHAAIINSQAIRIGVEKSAPASDGIIESIDRLGCRINRVVESGKIDGNETLCC